MNGLLDAGKVYRHFKGNYYELILIAQDASTGSDVVVYRAKYGEEKYYTRPLEEFMEKVERDGVIYQRFTEITPSELAKLSVSETE